MAQSGASVEEAESVAASHGAQWLYVIGNAKAEGF
jgi:hypothetical protein